MSESENIWKKRFERERAARKEAEKILETRASDLIESNQSMIQEYQSLEDIVYERTVELEEVNNKLRKEITRGKNIEKELVIARDAALKDLEKKSQFLARVSHDIRTPLNSIVGYAELVKQEQLSENQLGHVKKIEASTWVLLRVINDLLDMSKMEANKLDLYYKSCVIKDLVRSTVALVAPTAEHKNIELKLITSKNLPKNIYFDPNRFQQILTNILSNAVKFTEDGSITITVTLGKDEKTTIPKYDNFANDIPEDLKTRLLKVNITDTGIGIDDKSLPTIFDPFIQISRDSDSKDKGSGLGLSICKKMVELMGGKIMVSSKLGIGTEFVFTLPCGYLEQEENSEELLVKNRNNIAIENTKITPLLQLDEDEQQPSIKSYKNIALDHPLSILIADDTETNRAVLEAQLEIMGYRVDMVCNGEEVLRALKERSYDVILMDIRMPILDGMQTTKRIRTKNTIKQPHIIAVTASAIKGDREKFINCGINDYVSKPVFADKLVAALLKAHENINDTDKSNDSLIQHFENAESNRIEGNSEIILEDLEKRIGPAAKSISLKVFPVFIRELPSREKKILSSFKKHQIDEFREVCHGLKGSSRSVGASELGDLCEKFEILAEDGKLPKANEINLLINRAQATKTALKKKLKILEST